MLLINPVRADRIEAEDFTDYFDSDDVNRGGAHSNGGVDIEVTGDSDGNFSIGWTVAGEWVEYDLLLSESRAYDFYARVASDLDAGDLEITLDGREIAIVDVDNTGGWQSWTTAKIPAGQISAGSYKLRISWRGNAHINLNWFEFQARTQPDVTSLEILDGRVREGEEYSYRVRLSQPSTDVVRFKTYTLLGSAVNGADFFGIFEELAIDPGETEIDVPVTLLDDTVVENDEEFYQFLAGANVPITRSRGTTVIVDNDSDGGGSGSSSGGGSSSSSSGSSSGGGSSSSSSGSSSGSGSSSSGSGSGSSSSGSGSSSGSRPANYAENLARLRASPWRNTNEDSSPFRDTPSDQLYGESALYGTARDHLTRRGQYNGDVYYDTGYYPGNGAGTFRASCEVSHFSYDDPMVHPGEPESAHLHMFMGNTDTNAFSTYDSILNTGGSTCNGAELNRTAYWVPALFDGKGNVVLPFKALFYYKTEQAPGIGNVRTYPENLQLLADTKNNIQNNLHLATWRCNDIYNGAKATPSSTIPRCPAAPNGFPGAVEFMIFFDYCWNGDESSIGDYRANRDRNFVPPVNYWHSSVCPSSHPVLLPALATHIFYDIRPGDDTSRWFLSSDVNAMTGRLDKPGGSTAHADWIGAWNKRINAEWVENCNNIIDAECAAGTLADSEGDLDSTVRALKMRNDFITGYSNEAARMPVKEIYKSMCSVGADIAPDDGYAAAAFCRPH